MGRVVRAVVGAAMALATVAGCGDGSGDDEPAGGASPAPTSTAPTPSTDRPYQEVELTGDDGQTRAGRLFGDDGADVAVVLSHMGRNGDSPDDWTTMAEVLAGEGYLVMTYERLRPRYKPYEDLVGAVRYVRDELGIETVIAGGASLGAMASLHVALAGEPEVDGVVWIAGTLSGGGMSFDRASVSGLACPMFVASGDRDGYDAAPVAADIATWAPMSAEPLIVSSSAHGTDIFAEGGAPAADLETAIVDFVDTVAGQSRTPC